MFSFITLSSGRGAITDTQLTTADPRANFDTTFVAMEYQTLPQFHLLYRTVHAICAITYTVGSTQTDNSNLQLVMTKDYALGGVSNGNPAIHEPFYVTKWPK